MKKLVKIVVTLFIIFVLLISGVVVFITQAMPRIAVQENLKVEITPERITRGSYLANHVGVCMDCHSTRDWALFSAPPKEGTLGIGGERFDQTMGFPGAFIAPNITPHALKDWTDGELYRVITSGVTKEGHPMFPVMPYPAYGRMATEDVYSIIAYLRSIPAVASEPAESKADFPVNIIMHTIPKPAQPVNVPSPDDAVAYGAYLTNVAGCVECHTKMDKGKPVGDAFAGGFEFPMPKGTLVSANITPHPVTGIGAWSKQQFIDRFKAFSPDRHQPAAVDMMKGEMQTVMPWTMYAGMTEQDLGAMYDYLMTLKPVENQVERWKTSAQ